MTIRATAGIGLAALALLGCAMTEKSQQRYRAEQTPYIQEAAYV